MAVKVRLTRVGSKKNPVWRVVVADGRSPRDGRFIELIGHYNPQTQPSRIEIDRERLQYWLDRGAEPSNTIRKLMRAENTGFEIPQAERAAPVVAARRPAADEASEPVEAPAEGDAAPRATAEAEAPASEGDAGEAEADAAADAGEDKGDVDADADGDENA